jgi:site-specific recombinase XerD
MDKAQVREFLFSLAGTNEKAARGRTLAALRAFFAYLVREGYLPGNPLVGLDRGDVDLARRTVRVVRKGGDEQFVEFGAAVLKHHWRGRG